MIVALVPDLMDRSKVLAVAPGTRVVTSIEQLAAVSGPGATAVVDLAQVGEPVDQALAGLVATGARVVAFGSHVERGRLDAARAAGCDTVLPRSAFFARLAELLG